MEKLYIKVPATSANLGPGFDFLGIALNLFNTFTFERSEKFSFLGFDNIKDNLVYKSYIHLFKLKKKTLVPVKISFIEKDIPNERGLGSSASAIIAGMMAANYFMENELNEDELLKEMVDFEGHPDNIVPAYFGGLTSTYIKDKEIHKVSFDVANNLIFNLLIPKFTLKTEKARKVIKNEIPLCDVTFNASRVIAIPVGFEKGDISLLKDVMVDKIHEDARLPLIKKGKEIKEVASMFQVTCNISGAGPTLLVISKDDDFINYFKEKGFTDYHILKCTCNKIGTKMELRNE